MKLRPLFRSLSLLGGVLALAAPAGAQIPDLIRIDRPDSDSVWTGAEFIASPDLHWDEHLPASDPGSGAADVDVPGLPAANPADLGRIFQYRFVGEHSASLTGYSIAFSDDADCDGFNEVIIGAANYLDRPGAAYIVSMADVAAADAADGAADRVIDLGLVAAQPRSWKLVGQGLQYVGVGVAAGGNVDGNDGNGCSDLLVSARATANFTGSVYVISAADLPGADAADGAADGVVEIRRVADQPNSWELVGEASGDNAGYYVIFAGDVNGDRRSDVLISASFQGDDDHGAAYLLSGTALASADAEDGAADGRIALASVAAQPDSWKFVGEKAGDLAGTQLSAANLDSDTRSDLVIGAFQHTDAFAHQGAVYLLAASDLPAIDGADGQFDGLIDLGNASSGRASWKLVGTLENHRVGARDLAAGDLDGDGLDEVLIANPNWDRRHEADADVFVVSVSALRSADVADGTRDGVVRLDHALAQDGSFQLVWGKTDYVSVSSEADFDGDGLDDLLLGNIDFLDGDPCLPGGGARGDGAVALIPGGALPAADAADGKTDSIVDLNSVSSEEGVWKFIGEPTDRLGSSVSAGDVDGDGIVDPILASQIPHTPYLQCGSSVTNGFAFVMSGVHLAAADALDGATDGEIHLGALRVEVDPVPPVVLGVTQYEDRVVVMHISGSLKTADLDFDALASRFYEHYQDEFDYLIFVSNLPAVHFNQRYTYHGIHMGVRNSVTGVGLPVYGPPGTLKSTIHLSYRDALLNGPSLHEIMHAWANYAIPTTEPVHWGFSSANGQLGGFDLENLVSLGGNRYTAGRFGTFANRGNSVPYSPIELYFAGLIPPDEVPNIWVAKDGEWVGERDESGNPIFSASDIEMWSVQRIVAEHGVRMPDSVDSQKSFRAAIILLADDAYPATSTTLRDLGRAVRDFGHPGYDGRYGYNFWEATGGRATLKLDDLRGSGVAVVGNQPPVAVGTLAPLTIRVDEGSVVVDVAAAFRDPDGDALTYGAASSAPSVAAISVLGTVVTVTPVSEGTATVTVSATDTGGSKTTATQSFAVTVSPPTNQPPEAVGTLPDQRLQVRDGAVTVEVASAFRDPDDDALTYGATSSDVAVVTVRLSGSTVTMTPVAAGTATIAVTATDIGGSNTPATQQFRVTVHANQPPEAVGTLPDQRLQVRDGAVTVEVASAFRDPDDDALTYGATSSDVAVVTVRLSGSTVTMTPVAAGTATIAVTATDIGGSNTPATQQFRVTVHANQPPEAVGTLPDQRLQVRDGAVTVEVASAFRDPDDDALTYGATSSDVAVVTVRLSGSTVTMTPVAAGTATIAVTATDIGGSNTPATQQFRVTVHANQPPEAVGTLPDQRLQVRDGAVTVEVASAFRDPDDDALTYGATSSDVAVVTVRLSGSTVTMTPVAAGTATIAVTATDIGGSNTPATQQFRVTVHANQPPEAVGTLPDLTLHVSSPAVVNVARAFRDPEDDALVYRAMSSVAGVATGRVAGTQVTVTPAAPGTTMITVTVTDEGGSNTSASQRFTVTVPDGSQFTDRPIQRGTPVRAIHFLELRDRIDALRVREGLLAFRWTDSTITLGVTPVKRVHLTQLRAALDEVYDAVGHPRPSYTDTAVMARVTTIMVAHLMELRAAVVALE